MRWSPLAVVVSLALLSMAAAAQTSSTATYRFESPGSLLLTIDSTQNGSDAANTRRELDRDENEVVNESEVRQAEEEFLRLFQGARRNGTAGFTVDGHPHDNLSVEGFDIQDAVGPVQSTAPLRIQIAARLTFPVQAGATHVLRVNSTAGLPDQNVERSTVVMPPGYVVKSSSGLPAGAQVSSDKRRLDFAGSLNPDQEMTVTFAKASSGFGSTVVLLFVIVGVLVVGAVVGIGLRRRSQKGRPPV